MRHEVCSLQESVNDFFKNTYLSDTEYWIIAHPTVLHVKSLSSQLLFHVLQLTVNYLG